MLVHLINNQIEQRLTNCWVASISDFLEYSAKMLPGIIDENLVQLPGGEEWKEGRR